MLKKISPSLLILASYLTITFSCNTNNQTKVIDNEAVDSNIVKDIDGNIYHIVKIGKQVWLKENLKVTHFRNGVPIPNITDSVAWIEAQSGAYCNYNNDTAVVRVYGRLYNWYAVNDKRDICPEGWHVPSTEEFSYLVSYYGGTSICGMQLKEAGNLHWKVDNTATNASNFTALPGGHCDGGFSRLGLYTYFWNKEQYVGENCSIDKGCASECSFTSEFSYILQDWGHKYRGMSVRCIKDTVKID